MENMDPRPSTPAEPRQQDLVQQFQILQEHYVQEQTFYWQRFAAFAALHAGLFVLATSDSITKRWVLNWLGVILGLIWVLVQWASLYYADRVKPQYHKLREAIGIQYRSHRFFSQQRLSATDLAFYATLVVLLMWLLIALGIV